MKKLLLLVIVALLTGCEKYVSGTHLTLSGKYLITRISMVSVDKNTTRDTVYYPGDVYKSQNTLTPKPFDTIRVGNTFIHLDEMLINLRYIGSDTFGRDMWDKRYESGYRIWGNNQWQEGYIQFTYHDAIKTNSNPTMTFQITEDKLESLEFTSSGHWPYGRLGEKKIMILKLIRVGP
jgi:hypothetical protein